MKSTTKGARAPKKNWRSHTVHGLDHPLDEVERCLTILRVGAEAADNVANLADEKVARTVRAIASTLRDTACRLEDVVSGADATGGL